jgi:hypothetical protein
MWCASLKARNVTSTPAHEGSNFIHNLRQRGSVTIGEKSDAVDEGLGDAVQLALHSGGRGRNLSRS